jgi:NADH-quinone oxidoreductase subunit A
MDFYHDFGAVLLYAVLSFLFVIASLIAGSIIRPKKPYGEKLSTYECGEDTIGTAFVQFNVRFYIIALIFLIFDVEVAALIPWAVIYKKYGILALVEMGIFILILIAGFAYIWVKGDLEWVTSLGEIRESGDSTRSERREEGP